MIDAAPAKVNVVDKPLPRRPRGIQTFGQRGAVLA